MTLRYPLILLLILLAPALVYLRYGRRRKLSLRFSDGGAVAQLPVSWAVVFQPILPVFYTLGLVLLIVAMARPQKGLAESRVNTEALDIVLLVDVSTSMRAEDFTTATRTLNRLDAAKTVIERFIGDRPNDRIGMVAFSAMPYTVSPLTFDHGWLIRQMQRLETGMLEDGTAIGDAIASAVNRLRDSVAKSKVVILLTDGMNNRGALSPENAAQAAKALNIKVYTVGAGSTGLVRIPVMDPFGGRQYIRQPSEIDEGTLKRIADATSAMYFRATDLKGLEEVYRQIDRMEKTEVDIDQYTYFEEQFMPWLLMGLLLLGLEKVLWLTRLGRLP
jgi:Ca-activated chloride channel family protein